MNDTFKVELSTQLRSLIGHHIGTDHIHDDTCFYYYIKDLAPGHPLVMNHYRGPLMAVLPKSDYQSLKNGTVSVEEYISSSFWNFGFLWGGGGLLSGAYWQPLESESGIHDTGRISRYLSILSCRTLKNSSGYMPSPDHCKQCKLDETTCPFSPANQFGVWEKEVQEPDGRVALFSAISERLQQEIGFKLTVAMSHSNARNELLLFPAYELGTVEAYVNSSLLNDLLYHPGERDWSAMAQSLEITLGIPYQTERISLDPAITDKHAFCLEFWSDKTPKATEEESFEEHPLPKKRTSLLGFIRNMFEKLFTK